MFILLVALIVASAAFVQGLTGFGFALIAAPLLTLLLPATESVAIVLILTSLINIYLLKKYRSQIELKKLRLLLAPTILGIIVGGFMLPYLRDEILAIVMSIVALSLAFMLLFGRRKKVTSDSAVSSAGVASGFFNVTAGMGGPPVVLLLEEQHVRKKRMIGDLAAYFLILNIFSLIGLGIATDALSDISLAYIALVPLTMLGSVIGAELGSKLKEKQFHHIVLVLVVISGTVALINGLASLTT